MTLTSPITITLNAVAKSCVKINQDQYGSHYRYISSTERLDLKIRHTQEKAAANGLAFDRHNVELTWTTFSVDASVPDSVFVAYCVLRNEKTALGGGMGYLGTALADFLKVSGVLTDLVGWQN